MSVMMIDRFILAAVIAGASALPAAAGGHGGAGHGGAVFRPGGGFHGGFGGIRGGWTGGARPIGGRGLPPISGIIHERGGLRPYYSAYGHTGTAMRFGGGGAGAPRYGHTGTALTGGGGAYRFAGVGYGHLGTSLRYGARGRFAAAGLGRRFGGYGGFGGGFGSGYGFGGYGTPGLYGDAGSYGGQGLYGAAGTYGASGTYGGTATQAVYGNGGFASYRSERPLAARFAEPPLAPSPYAPYSPDDSYAYAAAGDVGPGPHVSNLHHGLRAGCGCGAERDPVIYRYGIGTAY